MDDSSGLSVLPLREQVYRALLDRLASGRWSAGTRVRDTEVAQELKVSRTPVREAFLRLQQEGLLLADHNRGFRVPAFAEREVREIYPMVWALEGVALESAIVTPQAVQLLREINRDLAGAVSDPAARRRVDESWHRALVGLAQNTRLSETVESLKRIVRRYEHAYMRNLEDVGVSVGEHEAILAALAGGQTSEARSALEGHWRRGMDRLLERMAHAKD